MKKGIIIIPTFNEKDNIVSLVETILKTLPEVELLVVDDSSPDGTGDLVKSLIQHFQSRLHLLVRPAKEGLGTAYIEGFKWAMKKEYDFIFEMDADFSHNPKELPKLIKHLDHHDLVIGSRYVNGISVVNWPIGRIFLSYFASLYVQWITNMPIKDPTAGYVGYTKKALMTLDLDRIRFVGYAFQIEMKYKLWKRGFKWIEHPIIFVNRSLGKSKMHGNIIWEALFGVLYLRFKKQ
ncbi:MAG: polyprenol monophosphomannose synthase [Flavobacteriaceae bacterium]